MRVVVEDVDKVRCSCLEEVKIEKDLTKGAKPS